MRRAALTTAAAALTLMIAQPAHAGMAEDCMRGIDPDLAIRGCSAAIRSRQWFGKNLANAYNNRGVAYNKLGQYGRAILDFDQAIRLDPGYAFAYNNRGSAFGALGELRHAIQDYDQALRIDPGYANAYVNRGVTYDELGEHSRAIQDYDQAIRVDPEYDDAYNNRAWALYLTGRYEQALVDVDRSLSLAPKNLETIDTRAHVLAALGRTGEAVAAFERAMKFGGADRVRTYQEALKKLGYFHGATDGTYGSRTRDALNACIDAGCRLME